MVGSLKNTSLVLGIAILAVSAVASWQIWGYWEAGALVGAALSSLWALYYHVRIGDFDAETSSAMVDAFSVEAEHPREKDESLSGGQLVQNPSDALLQTAIFGPQDRRDYARYLFQMIPVPALALDQNATIIYANQAFLDLFKDDQDVAGLSLDTLLSLSSQPDFKAFWQDLGQSQDMHQSTELSLALGSDKVGGLFVSRAAGDLDVAYVAFFIDRTQERSLHQQFVQAQKMQAIGQLAGGVAHDFNNLLTAILGFCDLLLARYGAGSRTFSDVMQIKQNANRAAGLVRQLLAFSRQQTMRPKVIRLSDALGELNNLLLRLIGPAIDLRLSHGRGLAPVMVDQGQFEQVIVNLVVNARDAMPSGGKLDIETKMVHSRDPAFECPDYVPSADFVLVEVKDTGTGISEDLHDKIFEPFFTTKDVGEGTGLGLATVYGIVKQMDGFIFVRSAPEQGTSFMVLLPPHRQDMATDNKVDVFEKAKDLSGSSTILLVEDEDAVRLLVSRALTARGYTVLEAQDGLDGLDMFEAHQDHIEMIITDVQMPGMDGPALIDEIHRQKPDLPVIYVSGYAEDVMRKSLEDDRYAFLQKPFSLKDMAALVKSHGIKEEQK